MEIWVVFTFWQLCKIPWRRERLPTPVFWPGEFQSMGSQRAGQDWATFTSTYRATRLPGGTSGVQSLGQEDSLEEEVATRSAILAWKIPRAEEPGGLQSMTLQTAGHTEATEHKELQWAHMRKSLFERLFLTLQSVSVSALNTLSHCFVINVVSDEKSALLLL